MDDALFLKHVGAIAKDFPPAGHRIERVEINGDQAVLHIIPKPGFAGEPKALAIQVSDDWDAIFVSLGNQRFFQRLYEPIPEIHP